MAAINCVHRQRIRMFEEAVRNHEMKGVRHPSLHTSTDEEYEHSKQVLEETFVHLYNKQR